MTPCERCWLRHVFGSVLEGRDTERSDIDLLVAARENVSVFGLGAFVADVQDLTGFPVDNISETQARPHHPLR